MDRVQILALSDANLKGLFNYFGFKCTQSADEVGPIAKKKQSNMITSLISQETCHIKNVYLGNLNQSFIT